jgi:hypothetical protein
MTTELVLQYGRKRKEINRSAIRLQTGKLTLRVLILKMNWAYQVVSWKVAVLVFRQYIAFYLSNQKISQTAFWKVSVRNSANFTFGTMFAELNKAT